MAKETDERSIRKEIVSLVRECLRYTAYIIDPNNSLSGQYHLRTMPKWMKPIPDWREQ